MCRYLLIALTSHFKVGRHVSSHIAPFQIFLKIVFSLPMNNDCSTVAAECGISHQKVSAFSTIIFSSSNSFGLVSSPACAAVTVDSYPQSDALYLHIFVTTSNSVSTHYSLYVPQHLMIRSSRSSLLHLSFFMALNDPNTWAHPIISLCRWSCPLSFSYVGWLLGFILFLSLAQLLQLLRSFSVLNHILRVSAFLPCL